MQKEKQKVIQENVKRLEALNAYYDPLTGEGSLLERFEFKISGKEKIYLPLPMKELKVIQIMQKYCSLEN
jgi:hypothetical protein